MDEYENPGFRRSVSRMPSSISITVNSGDSSDHEFPKSHYRDTKSSWGRTSFSSMYEYIPGQVLHPHAKSVRIWNKFFIFSCVFRGFIDSLFLFLQSVKWDDKCIVVDRTMTEVLIFLQSLINFIYLLHMLLQFRLAYVAPESRVLVENPKRIVFNYLSGYFLIDFFVLLPLSQVIMCLILQKSIGASWVYDAINFLQVALISQYVAMVCRVLPLLANQSTSGFSFDSWLAKFVINLATFVLFSHVVGSCWYLFALQRVKECLKSVCHKHPSCFTSHIYCWEINENGGFKDYQSWEKWRNISASACTDSELFDNGIYVQATGIMKEYSLPVRYIYSLFWGFQQISTLAGNQTPSMFVWEIFFTMFITATGLVLFSLLIGNMQNFLQALGRRSLEMSVRRLDVEQWMSHHQLPKNLRRQIRESERYNWAVNKGLNELKLLEKLPEDLQRDIRRHLFIMVQRFPIFACMNESILDAIRERLKQKTYITGSRILVPGSLIDKMVFVVQGKLKSIGEDNNVVLLSSGDVCGEELITLWLEHFALNTHEKRVGIPVHKLLSNRTVRCLTNVEAFTLQATDVEDIISLYSGLLIRNPFVQGTIKKESRCWQGFPANRLKLAWSCKKKRLNRSKAS